MVIVIDNYDSFTYNLVQAIGALGEKITVFRNDKVGLDEIRNIMPAHILISPGPCTPAESGISVEVISAFSESNPILGVCLGHQAMAVAFGGKVARADRLMHGKTSMVHHDGEFIFRGVDNPFQAMRYHSLTVDEDTLPGCFMKTAWTRQGELMGIRHRERPLFGVQFHPESFMTPQGKIILQNFLNT